MTKSEWINSLKGGQQRLVNFLFRYYKSKGGTGTPQQFATYYPYLNMEHVISDINGELEVTVLVSKEGVVLDYF